MTLDELTMIARRASNCTWGRSGSNWWGALSIAGHFADFFADFKVAVLAVLEAVERECVPQNFVADPKLDYEVGYNYCRAEMLRRLTEMRK